MHFDQDAVLAKATERKAAYEEYKSHFRGYFIRGGELYRAWESGLSIEEAQRKLVHRKREYALRSRVPMLSLAQAQGLIHDAMLKEGRRLSRYALDDAARVFVNGVIDRSRAVLAKWADKPEG